MQEKQKSKRPKAVLISDVHYNLQTLELADAALTLAFQKAHQLVVPIIIAGDLHDTKANLRAECTIRLQATFDRFIYSVDAYILRGNHDSINEKSDVSALHFLTNRNRTLVERPGRIYEPNLYLIPYHHDPDELRAYLKTIPKGSTLIMHQGIKSANSGEYFHDKSAINKEDLADFRVISGHYHARQDIHCGPHKEGWVGLASYIGNPYTLNYGEAKDPEKGFQVLYDDGSLEFIPTNLRRHIVHEINLSERFFLDVCYKEEDLILVKATGTKEQIEQRGNKEYLAKALDIHIPFRLDLIPLDSETDLQQIPFHSQTESEIISSLIDSMQNTSEDKKTRLKDLWGKL